MSTSFTQYSFGSNNKQQAVNIADISAFSTESITPEQLKDVRLAMATHLQTTLDTEQLFTIFFRHLKQLVPVSGIEYRNGEKAIELAVGHISKHKCNYQLSMTQQHFGDVSFSRGKRFSEKEMSTIESIMDILIFPLRNALKYRDALATAMIDPLTGLNNRGAMAIALNREIERSKRHDDQDLSILMIDVDDFKPVNDRYGHLAGDDILRHVAQVLQRSIRGSDACFRFGGEEFVILLTNTNLPNSRAVAERIRMEVEEEVRLPDRDRPVTISIGLAHYNNESDWPQLIERADKALYSAKHQGKNRVVAAFEKRMTGHAS